MNNFKHQRQYEKISKINPFSELITEYYPEDIIVQRLLQDAKREQRENAEYAIEDR